ncbi:phage P2 GpU family protein [Campylobacter iguaniorum]|uniref:phage tail protein n=1 Tax=Campylobacter iguaniorum TaxID=1244531 RepID=UPI00073A0760|nr:phage tail protein [Campylobacter iguaniorum]ALV25028.1 phage P2 GpU family protein [Campylobacter iguaniorum]
MLAQIGNFTFEIHKNGFDRLNKKIEYKFNQIERIGNFNDLQSIGKYETTLNLSGVLILRSINELKAFEELASKKQALTLALGSGEVYSVVVLSLKLDRSAFLSDGMFLRQSFDISLGVNGDGL